MLSGVIRSVGDAATDKEAWNKIFTDFNKRNGKGAVGYKKGEKIAIKLNLNQCRNHGDGANASYIAPQLVQALLRQLVTEVGVAPADITFYDAIRNVPSTIFDRCTKEFPGVHFVDSIGGDGREKAVPATTNALNLATGGNPIYFPTCVTEAEYLINVAGLKGHTMAGMTVCAKNHLGSIFTPDGAAAARNMHSTLAVKVGSRRRVAPQAMGSYNSLVDLNGHKELGGKTVLYLIDGLYATKHNEYRLDPDMQMGERAVQRSLDLEPVRLAGRRGDRLGGAGLPAQRTHAEHDRHRRGGQLPARSGAGEQAALQDRVRSGERRQAAGEPGRPRALEQCRRQEVQPQPRHRRRHRAGQRPGVVNRGERRMMDR